MSNESPPKNVQTYKSFNKLNFMALNCMLGNVFYGYMLGVYNPIQKYIRTEYGWNNSEDSLNSGLLTALIPIGALLGCVSAGPISNSILVRKTLIIADLLAVVGVGITMVNTYLTFSIGRLISGYAVGLNSTLVPIYLSEISPKEIAGLLTSYTQIGVNAGILISDLFGLAVPEAGSPDSPNYWRLMFGFPVVTLGLRLIMLLFVFNKELPLYYLKKGQKEQAKEVIIIFFFFFVIKKKLNCKFNIFR
jgi:MFS transporter, SP family, major inositol transporter